MNQFYRLKDHFLLRGLHKLPWTLVNTQTGAVRFLTSRAFEIIELADGNHDFSLPDFSPIQRAIAQKLMEIGYLELCQRPDSIRHLQKYKVFENRFISSVQGSITSRCNYRCRHCLLSSPEIKEDELSFRQIQQIISQMAQAGIYKVMLTGGEPLVRKDFLDIVDEFKAHDIQITAIYTNGALVEEKLLDALAEKGMKPTFYISFDGLKAHDWLRDIPGAEKKAKKAFLLCREKGFATQADYCLFRKNKDVLFDSIEALANWGVGCVKIGPIDDVGEWKKQEKELKLTDQEFYQILLDLVETCKKKPLAIAVELMNLARIEPEPNQKEEQA